MLVELFLVPCLRLICLYLCWIDGINIRIHETISNTCIEYINVSILLHDRTKAIGVSLALWPKEH